VIVPSGHSPATKPTKEPHSSSCCTHSQVS
jgi:hypothetical protein